MPEGGELPPDTPETHSVQNVILISQTSIHSKTEITIAIHILKDHLNYDRQDSFFLVNSHFNNPSSFFLFTLAGKKLDTRLLLKFRRVRLTGMLSST